MDFFNMEWQIVERYGYPHTVISTLLNTTEESEQEITYVLNEEWAKFEKRAEIKFNVKSDNKTVLKIQHNSSDTIMFIGEYDGRVSLGFGVRKVI